MKIVKELLKNKGSEVWNVSPDTHVFEALEYMAEKNVGALPVIESEKIVGMFSERDYARKVILKGKASKNTLIKEIMSTTIHHVSPEQTIVECMALMTEKRIRHLPVFESDELVGLISIGDVVKAIISEQDFIMGQLENYITGSR
ncbi:MAG: CBS domain-containing protein [Candidatus Marinimicrobia bacterium]|nr:CBS domain-containing protein [Candidatus Neomarinimicrobiota bacterium]